MQNKELYARSCDGAPPEPISKEDFVALSEDKSRTFIVAMSNRPGACLFAAQLEFDHFPPLSPLNEEFQVYMVLWNHLEWFVISLPAKKYELAEEVAKQNCLRIADGVPVFMGNFPVSIIAALRQPPGNGIPCEFFLLQGDNVFTLENNRESPIYGDPKSADEIRRSELGAVERLQKEFLTKEAKQN